MISSLVNLIKTSAVSNTSKDTGNFPVQQVTYMGKTADSVVVMPYGTHANLPIDTLMLQFNVNAQEQNLQGIPHTPTKRIKNLATGEVIFYHPDTKSFIHFRASGDIDIDTTNATGDVNITVDSATITAATALTVTAPDINLVGDLHVTGDTDFTGTVTANGTVIDETHTHSGVTTGAGVTGPVV